MQINAYSLVEERDEDIRDFARKLLQEKLVTFIGSDAHRTVNLASGVQYIRETCGEDYAVLVMPDHPTPLCLLTHVADPVPFALFSSKHPKDNGKAVFNEHNARASGLFVPRACDLMEKLLK